MVAQEITVSLDVRTMSSYAMETLQKHTDLPHSIRRAFLMPDSQMLTSEIMLWREVAARATLDAFGLTPEVVTITDSMRQDKLFAYCRVVTDARKWFDTQDADDVFELAGFDVKPVRAEIVKLPKLKLLPAHRAFNLGKLLRILENKCGTCAYVALP
jgi:hypothetical protein